MNININSRKFIFGFSFSELNRFYSPQNDDKYERETSFWANIFATNFCLIFQPVLTRSTKLLVVIIFLISLHQPPSDDVQLIIHASQHQLKMKTDCADLCVSSFRTCMRNLPKCSSLFLFISIIQHIFARKFSTPAQSM